jgi:hypothetical protein
MNKPILRPTRTFPVVLLSCAITAVAHAGTAKMQNADGSEAVFEYNSTMLRIGAGEGDTDGYAVIRDGSFYVVSLNDGQPIVMDAGSMMRGMGDMSAYAAPEDLTSEFLGIEDTGRSETVAGVAGTVYELRVRDGNGEEQREEIVLSDDPRAIEFRDALYLMIDVASSLNSQASMDAGRSIQEKLIAMDAGVLRYGQEMRITSIDDRVVDESRFALPAQPMDLEALGGMLGAMGQQAPASPESTEEGSNGGLFSGMMNALGNKAERQSDRVGDAVEEEVDRETDEQVDSAIGKAFGKLFGRP